MYCITCQHFSHQGLAELQDQCGSYCSNMNDFCCIWTQLHSLAPKSPVSVLHYMYMYIIWCTLLWANRPCIHHYCMALLKLLLNNWLVVPFAWSLPGLKETLQSYLGWDISLLLASPKWHQDILCSWTSFTSPASVSILYFQQKGGLRGQLLMPG